MSTTFLNTEFAVTLQSGAYTFRIPFGLRTKVSGATVVTVASGAAILLGVHPQVRSGSQASFSGVRITVNDATSGMVAPESGITLYNFSYGNHSGALGDGMVGRIAPTETNINALCLSGISVQGGTGHDVTIVYAKGE